MRLQCSILSLNIATIAWGQFAVGMRTRVILHDSKPTLNFRSNSTFSSNARHVGIPDDGDHRFRAIVIAVPG